jgi:hypothetical protein
LNVSSVETSGFFQETNGMVSESHLVEYAGKVLNTGIDLLSPLGCIGIEQGGFEEVPL